MLVWKQRQQAHGSSGWAMQQQGRTILASWAACCVLLLLRMHVSALRVLRGHALCLLRTAVPWPDPR